MADMKGGNNHAREKMARGFRAGKSKRVLADSFYTTERGTKYIPDYEPAYPSLPGAEAGTLEAEVKKDYKLADWHDPKNPAGYPGWHVTDLRTNEGIVYSPNSREVTTREYLKEPGEDVLDLTARVAVNIATAERKYDSSADILGTAKRFAKRMIHREFAPNTPTFANAGRHLQQLAACFGMIPQDYLGTDDIGEDPEKQGDGIFDVLRYGSMVQKSGGGTGYNFSYTRPRNSGIATTGGRASGPVSWARAYNGGTQEINQGGFRRGANMGILEFWHPDIFEFLSAKANNKIPFFNLSLGTDAEYWKKYGGDGYFFLVSPKDMDRAPLEERILTAGALLKKSEFERLNEREKSDIEPSLLISEDGRTVIVRYTGAEVGFIDGNGRVNISARAMLKYTAEMACRTGCPGVIFFDRMNEDNPTPHVGSIRVVNPCGEQPLLDYEACNLGSVNLYSCVEEIPARRVGASHESRADRRGGYFYGRVLGTGERRIQRRLSLRKLREIVEDSVHFLDNVIDMGKYPFRKIYSHVKANRKIGLGLMGVAEVLMALGIPYESEECERFAEFISGYMYKRALAKSRELAERRGVFPNWRGSIYDPRSPCAKRGVTEHVRNATLLTIAPNGTTGQFAGVTGGIEPMFGLYFEKNITGGPVLHFRNEIFEQELRQRGLFSEELIERVKKAKSIQRLDGIPQDMKDRYKLTIEVDPIWHVRIQAAFQKHVDNAVSKTVNLPEGAKPEDFLKIFLEARKRGCKGVTGYRQGTIAGQPLTMGESIKIPKRIRWVHIPIESPAITMADNSSKYRVERGDEAFHVIYTDALMRHKKTGELYFWPREDFQCTAPLGEERSVEFAQSGIERTTILKGADPDLVRMIEGLKAVRGDRSAGFGHSRINSQSHAVGLVLEHACLSRGLVKYEEVEASPSIKVKKLVQVVKKPELEPVPDEEAKEILKRSEVESRQRITDKVVGDFLCPSCGSTRYIFEQGCNDPVCANCHRSAGKCS